MFKVWITKITWREWYTENDISRLKCIEGHSGNDITRMVLLYRHTKNDMTRMNAENGIAIKLYQKWNTDNDMFKLKCWEWHYENFLTLFNDCFGAKRFCIEKDFLKSLML